MGRNKTLSDFFQIGQRSRSASTTVQCKTNEIIQSLCVCLYLDKYNVYHVKKEHFFLFSAKEIEELSSNLLSSWEAGANLLDNLVRSGKGSSHLIYHLVCWQHFNHLVTGWQIGNHLVCWQHFDHLVTGRQIGNHLVCNFVCTGQHTNHIISAGKICTICSAR